ncbi:hypothetical protein FKM82_005677 [Ascaphus truei]
MYKQWKRRVKWTMVNKQRYTSCVQDHKPASCSYMRIQCHSCVVGGRWQHFIYGYLTFIISIFSWLIMSMPIRITLLCFNFKCLQPVSYREKQKLVLNTDFCFPK